MTERSAAPPPPTRDVHFSVAMHLRNLLRLDRTFSVKQAVRAAVRPGARVLDAGCGMGILSFLALEAGAGEIVAVDRDHVDLARDLARANGVEDRIRFLEADLRQLTPADLSGRFDTLFAFIYTNHIVVDEARSTAVCDLRHRFGLPSCVTVPNRVVYRAVPCDWPPIDVYSELTDLRRSVTDLEQRCGLKLGPLFDAMTTEIGYNRSRPVTFGDYDWSPGFTNGGYRHRRGGGRFLGDPAPVTEIRYDGGGRFVRLPERAVLTVESAGILNAVMWIQELWFGDFLIWSTEVFSPLIDAVPVRRGDRVSVLLNDAWRSTNALTVDNGFRG
ncbi:50S ribosomal protein L11 methyltransferase [Azospirillum griseum]|uniref:Class I SAM-dependent methyltransferase n=1 Tax=Azospirillum griseum TaxID=2496639 RepID=A0A3S0K2W9_9PROT|nr:50S ribosomal protein L11 methyltransferase [Azospirillum griseum]RTR17367.1 class I SAM-dependent methyltransferase [Azospirillum griseum]